MGNSKGIVKRIRIETIDAAKYLIKDMSSTTIESIVWEKDLHEEASRVHHKYDGNGRYPYFGNRGMDSDIVWSYMVTYSERIMKAFAYYEFRDDYF